jgi:hypothetical protein
MYIQSLQTVTNNESVSYLEIVADKLERITIKIFGEEGLVAKKLTADIEAGRQQLMVNLNDLASGIYTLNAFIGDVFIKSIRFVKP